MTSNPGKCGTGYLDNKLPQDAHYSINSSINYLQMHNLHKKGCIPIFTGIYSPKCTRNSSFTLIFANKSSISGWYGL